MYNVCVRISLVNKSKGVVGIHYKYHCLNLNNGCWGLPLLYSMYTISFAPDIVLILPALLSNVLSLLVVLFDGNISSSASLSEAANTYTHNTMNYKYINYGNTYLK